MSPRNHLKTTLGLTLMGMAIGWSPSTNPAVPRSSIVAASSSSRTTPRCQRSIPQIMMTIHDNDERPDTNITETILSNVHRKIKVAKAQSEIDRILAGPDAPFDAESELKKVVHIVATDTDDNDDTIAMETALYQAIDHQDFATAARQKHALEQTQMDSALAVLQVNAAFYKAFSQRDAITMKQLWVPDKDSVCINPSTPMLLGSQQIDKSWETLFTGSSKYQSWIEPTNIRIAMRGSSTAIVTCDELVFARRFVRGHKRQSEQINTLTTTNIFRKIDSQWKICHHHASWHHEADVGKYALQAATMRQLGTARPRQRPRNAEIQMDGILGSKHFGPMLGNRNMMKNSNNGRVKVVRGNLADLLGGNLKDILNGNTNNNDKASDESSDAVIEFHEIHNLEEDDDEEEEDGDEDDDEEEYVDETELYSQESPQAVSIVKQFSDMKRNANETFEKTRITQRRQSCIQLLRELCDKGSISPKQKRVLLTDIIACSAKREASLVEAAFELLYDGGADLDAAEEDFADQCRVLAGSLADV